MRRWIAMLSDQTRSDQTEACAKRPAAKRRRGSHVLQACIKHASGLAVSLPCSLMDVRQALRQEEADSASRGICSMFEQPSLLSLLAAPQLDGDVAADGVGQPAEAPGLCPRVRRLLLQLGELSFCSMSCLGLQLHVLSGQPAAQPRIDNNASCRSTSVNTGVQP